MPFSVTARTKLVVGDTAILTQADLRRTDASSSVRTPSRKAAAAEFAGGSSYNAGATGRVEQGNTDNVRCLQ